MANKNYNYNKTKFIISASDISNLPNDHGIEIAFVGRSNSGKSSALNILTQQKNLAHTSKITGKTQLINLFEVTNGVRLVDLPGYGYAEGSKLIKLQCKQVANEYIQKRKCLIGLIILMDIRHPLKYMDMKMIKWSVEMNVSMLILLTKADKLIFNKQKTQIITVRNILKTISTDIQVEVFSSLKKIGVNKLQLKLDEWVNWQRFKHN
ncbi:MAG: ribosome biogenesis GTP-binding protein YihA/YsxC [Arsenophonus sp.]